MQGHGGLLQFAVCLQGWRQERDGVENDGCELRPSLLVS